MRRSEQVRGTTVIQVLIVVVILVVIGVFALPNLHRGLAGNGRGRQKRTMGDLRTIGTALDSYRMDHGLYPHPSGDGTVAALRPLLEPTFIKAVPTEDAWGNAYLYVTAPPHDAYTLTSRGKDGEANGPLGTTTDFEHDLVFATGAFLAWPEGTQN